MRPPEPRSVPKARLRLSFLAVFLTLPWTPAASHVPLDHPQGNNLPAEWSAALYCQSSGKEALSIRGEEPSASPATFQLVAAAQVLLAVGPHYQFPMTLGHDGLLNRQSGELHGNLFIELAAPEMLTPEELWELLVVLQGLGIRKVEGCIAWGDPDLGQESPFAGDVTRSSDLERMRIPGHERLWALAGMESGECRRSKASSTQPLADLHQKALQLRFLKNLELAPRLLLHLPIHTWPRESSFFGLYRESARGRVGKLSPEESLKLLLRLFQDPEVGPELMFLLPLEEGDGSKKAFRFLEVREAGRIQTVSLFTTLSGRLGLLDLRLESLDSKREDRLRLARFLWGSSGQCMSSRRNF